MFEQTDEQMFEQTDGQMFEQTDGQKNRRTDRVLDFYIDGVFQLLRRQIFGYFRG